MKIEWKNEASNFVSMRIPEKRYASPPLLNHWFDLIHWLSHCARQIQSNQTNDWGEGGPFGTSLPI